MKSPNPSSELQSKLQRRDGDRGTSRDTIRRKGKPLVARLATGENPITVPAPVLQASELPALPSGEEREEL